MTSGLPSCGVGRACIIMMVGLVSFLSFRKARERYTQTNDLMFWCAQLTSGCAEGEEMLKAPPYLAGRTRFDACTGRETPFSLSSIPPNPPGVTPSHDGMLDHLLLFARPCPQVEFGLIKSYHKLVQVSTWKFRERMPF